MKKIQEYKYPLRGFLIGFFVGLAIEYLILKIGKSGNLLIAAQYIKRTGPILQAMDGALFGGLIGFLLKLARSRI
jgi:hypothetical protein